MYLDQETIFSDSQVPATTGSPVTSSNVYDAQAAVNLGGGARNIRPFVFISAKAGTTPTIRAVLTGADNAALTTNPVPVWDSGVLADPVTIPQLLKGACQSHTPKRFFGFIYTIVGTGGTFTVISGLVLDTPTVFGQ